MCRPSSQHTSDPQEQEGAPSTATRDTAAGLTTEGPPKPSFLLAIPISGFLT